MTLSQHQQKIFDDITQSIEESLSLGQKFMGSLSGPAGTGKSVMTSMLIKFLLEKYNTKALRITTPTHKSLRVINAMIDKNIKKHRNFSTSTIHSYLKLKLEKVEDRIVLIEDFDDKKLDKTKILIIDESSMVSKSLFEHIKNKQLKTGLEVILFVGDKMQLPPVEGEYNPVYEEIQQFELTEVVRQAQDNPLLKKATEIRYCIEQKQFNKDVLNFNSSDTGIIVYTDLQEWLKHYLDNKTDKTLTAFTNNSVNAYNHFVRCRVNGNSQLPKLIEGEEVILQEAFEDDNKFLSNGDVLTVYSPYIDQHPGMKVNYWSFTPKESDVEGINVRVLDDDSTERYNELLQVISNKAKVLKKENNHKEAREMWDKYWKVKNYFVEIKYNFAHTVHKLQGSTYDDLYLNFNEIQSNVSDDEMLFRLIYVALTRARNNVYILI